MKQVLDKSVSWVCKEKFASRGVTLDMILTDLAMREEFLGHVQAAMKVTDTQIMSALLEQRDKFEGEN